MCVAHTPSHTITPPAPQTLVLGHPGRSEGHPIGTVYPHSPLILSDTSTHHPKTRPSHPRRALRNPQEREVAPLGAPGTAPRPGNARAREVPPLRPYPSPPRPAFPLPLLPLPLCTPLPPISPTTYPPPYRLSVPPYPPSTARGLYTCEGREDLGVGVLCRGVQGRPTGGEPAFSGSAAQRANLWITRENAGRDGFGDL